MGLSFFDSVPGLALGAGTGAAEIPQEILQFRGKKYRFSFLSIYL